MIGHEIKKINREIKTHEKRIKKLEKQGRIDDAETLKTLVRKLRIQRDNLQNRI